MSGIDGMGVTPIRADVQEAALRGQARATAFSHRFVSPAGTAQPARGEIAGPERPTPTSHSRRQLTALPLQPQQIPKDPATVVNANSAREPRSSLAE